MSRQPLFEKPHCPHCHISLLGAVIPGTDTRYRLAIGVKEPGIYDDGALYWQCPSCGGTWQRFDITERRLHNEALYYMRGRQDEQSSTA